MVLVAVNSEACFLNIAEKVDKRNADQLAS